VNEETFWLFFIVWEAVSVVGLLSRIQAARLLRHRAASLEPQPQDKGAPPQDIREMSEEDIRQLYERHRTLLLHVGCRKFRIPESEVESLIQDVFLSFIMTKTKIENIRAWLIAAMCNASRHYWRSQGRPAGLPEDNG
jgi:hypothetical protein